MSENNIPIVWENSIDDFDNINVKDFYSNVENFTEGFNKEFPLKNVEVHIGQPSKEKGFDSKNFVLKLHMHLKDGKMFLSEAEDPHINLALSKAIQEIHHQSQLSDRQKHSNTGGHRL